MKRLMALFTVLALIVSINAASKTRLVRLEMTPAQAAAVKAVEAEFKQKRKVHYDGLAKLRAEEALKIQEALGNGNTNSAPAKPAPTK